MEFLRYPQLIPAFFNIRVVRTSTASYRRFILSMDRSPGFGSTAHNFRPLQTRSRFGSGALRLNLAAHSNSPARSTKSTRSLSLPLLVNIGFQVLFHSPPGVLFTFPSRYYTLSVTKSYLALGDGPPVFPPDSTCPVVLWILTTIPTISLTRLLLSFVQLSNCVRLCLIIDYVSPSPLQISLSKGLGSFPFAHHYLGNRLFSFSSSGYLDVSVPRVPHYTLCIHV